MNIGSSELIALNMKTGAALESQSGLHVGNPKIYGKLTQPPGAKAAAILLHPTSNYMGHYLIDPLAGLGITTLALNTRFAGNDSLLQMEYVLLDIGVGVAHLRDLGYNTVVLIGNSGGAAAMAFYQAQAENLTISETPAGDPVKIEPADLPTTDGIALTAAHVGRARIMATAMDPSVVDEADPLRAEASLDMYAPVNGPPYSPDFINRYRAAQRRRNDRISARACARLKELRKLDTPIQDEAFLVFRTYADLRYLDLSIDANQRPPGGIRTHSHGISPRDLNYSTNTLGRFTTCTSWLSQWSMTYSQADGPNCLAATSVPALLIDHTADGSVYPCDIVEWRKAAAGRLDYYALDGGTHYLSGQPDYIATSVSLIADWAAAI
jgi:hypothetical protein